MTIRMLKILRALTFGAIIFLAFLLVKILPKEKPQNRPGTYSLSIKVTNNGASNLLRNSPSIWQENENLFHPFEVAEKPDHLVLNYHHLPPGRYTLKFGSDLKGGYKENILIIDKNIEFDYPFVELDPFYTHPKKQISEQLLELKHSLEKLQIENYKKRNSHSHWD